MRRLAAISVGVVGLAIVVLAVAQLVLPGIAARHIRDQLRGSGEVRSVSVHAFPAIELLWHHADRVTVALGADQADAGRLGHLLGQAGDVGTLTATAATVRIGLLTLHDATLTAHGHSLSGTGTVADSDLQRAIPLLESVTPIASAGGALTLRGTATLLGISASVDATVAARAGALVIAPDLPLGGLATITIFAQPQIAVTGVSASAISGGFVVRATARLR